MKPGISQTGSLRQELRINPRLYQAMDMLTCRCSTSSST